MPALTKRRGADISPWHELENRMRSFFDYPFLGPTVFATPLLENGEWFPAVELVEADGEFVLTAEIPGMTKENVDISIEDNVLTLKGEKWYEHEEEKERMHIRERRYGSF